MFPGGEHGGDSGDGGDGGGDGGDDWGIINQPPFPSLPPLNNIDIHIPLNSMDMHIPLNSMDMHLPLNTMDMPFALNAMDMPLPHNNIDMHLPLNTTIDIPLAPNFSQFHNQAPPPQSDERYPAWEIQEIQELIRVRAELQERFPGNQRIHRLWELCSERLREKGYTRNSHQCQNKWNSITAKYRESKEMEGTQVDFSNQFPYLEELNEYFSVQEKQMSLNSEPGSSNPGKRGRATGGGQPSEDTYEEIYDMWKTFVSDEEWIPEDPTTVKKKKVEKEKSSDRPNIPDNTNTSSNQPNIPYNTNTLSDQPNIPDNTNTSSDQPNIPDNTNTSSDQPNIPDNTNTLKALTGLVETLQSFFQQQLKTHMLWMESMERHAQERALFEQEWRKSMEKLERERLMMENARQEREEQRRSREENRTERTDALLTALLNKLGQGLA